MEPIFFLFRCKNPKRWFWKITKSSNSFPLVNKKKTCQNSPKQWVQSNNHSFICSLLKFVCLGVPQVLYYRCPHTEVSKTLLIKISIETSCTCKQEGLNLRFCFFLIHSKNLQAVPDLSRAPMNLWDFFLTSPVSCEFIGLFFSATAFLQIWKCLFHLPCQWSYPFTFLIPGLVQKLSHGTLWPEKNYCQQKDTEEQPTVWK